MHNNYLLNYSFAPDKTLRFLRSMHKSIRKTLPHTQELWGVYSFTFTKKKTKQQNMGRISLKAGSYLFNLRVSNNAQNCGLSHFGKCVEPIVCLSTCDQLKLCC